MVLYPMREMLAHIESRYLLVNMVAHRAREIVCVREACAYGAGGSAQWRASSGSPHRVLIFWGTAIAVPRTFTWQEE